MMPINQANLTSRRKYVLAFPLLNLVRLIGLGKQPLPWLEICLVSAIFVLYLVTEFVLMPRMSLPPSRWCSRCDARSPEKSPTCVGCGREFAIDKLALYPIDTNLLLATKKAGRFAIAIVVVLTLPAFTAWLFFQRFGGPAVGASLFLFMITYGFELAKWMFLRRIVRQVCQHSGSVCTRCVYPIDESMTICPECGARETAAHARHDWLTTGLWLPGERITPALVATSSSPTP